MPDDLLRAAVGREIARRRQLAGLSQAELGRAAGIPRGTVIGYEHGRRYPPIPALVDIAAALGCTAGQIVDGAVTHRPEKILGNLCDPH